jgi:HPt (histidine-containing phosphotransfer) domain-containing protein
MKYKVIVDKDFIDIIPDYLQRRKEELFNLKNLVLDENFDEIKKIGHKMIGSGSGYGFDFITEKGRELETSAINKDKEKIVKIIEQLEDYLSNLDITYE